MGNFCCCLNNFLHNSNISYTNEIKYNKYNYQNTTIYGNAFYRKPIYTQKRHK
jgi:hypothetical protein